MLRLEILKVFVSPPSAKGASVRALLFDISFLMLCHVAQTYGSEVSILQGDGALTLCCSLPASSSGQLAMATIPTAILLRGIEQSVPFTGCRWKSVLEGSVSARRWSRGGCSLPEGFGCTLFMVPWCQWEH